MRKMKNGKIIPNGVTLEKHEFKTVLLITKHGINVELIPKSNRYGVHTPDIIINGIAWEIKSPIGDGKYTIQNTIQRAIKQSKYIIVDLRRTKRHQQKCIRELKNEFNKSKNLKQLIVITKTGRILDFKK